MMLVEDPPFYPKNDKFKLQKSYNAVRRGILVVTLLFCLIASVKFELYTPERVVGGMNIIIAASAAQFGNCYLREQSSKSEKAIMGAFLLFLIGFMLFGAFYEFFN